MFFAYILYSDRLDSFYVGSTGNLQDRITRHNGGRSTYTKRGIPWTLVYQKEYCSKSETYRAELYIKSQN